MLLVATAFAVGKDDAKTAEFAKQFRAKFGEEADVHAALAYDAVKLVVKAIQQGQSSTPERIRDELLKIKDFAGATGTLAFGPDPQLRRPVLVARIEASGPPTLLQQVPPRSADH